jgi:hypothetical protein
VEAVGTGSETRTKHHLDVVGTGRIETHGALRRMTENGTAASAGTENRTSQRAYSITNNWTINGADDPRGVADQIDSRFAMLMRGLENEQRGLLSD